MGQIRFIEWLINLNDASIGRLVDLQEQLRLPDFEVESLRNMQWLRTMGRSARSTENYPDMFHVWAAQRNRMDAFLTLERRLPNTVASFPKSSKTEPTFQNAVIRPLELLSD